MKKLKIILSLLFIAALIAVIWYKSAYSEKSYKTTEFLFDTTCSVTAYGNGAKEAAEEAFSIIEKIHLLANFYSDTSDVSKINAAAVGEAVSIDKMTAEILSLNLEISEKTGGVFDPTIAPLSELWDLGGENPHVPNDEEIAAAAKMVDYTAIILDKENLTVTKTKDVKIDLGASAKGYACDKAVEVFKGKGIPAIIDLGGNVSCTGKNPTSKNGMWKIGLQVPFAATGSYEQVIEIEDGSVVTSGTYQRYFEENGEKYHHILDPDTGFPKEADYDAVTVVTDSSLLGDCLSTACFLVGRDTGEKLAGEYGAKVYYY